MVQGIVFMLMFMPGVAAAQDFQSVSFHAIVEHVSEERSEQIPGTDVEQSIQTIIARLDAGERITFTNDRVRLQAGDSFYGTYLETRDGERIYTVTEPDRRGALITVVALFSVVTVIVGGFVGFRALIALLGSGAIVFVYLLPELASGAPPIFTSVVAAAGILAFAMVVTHGFRKTTLAALVASVATIGIAAFLAEFFVSFARLTGFTDDASVILNLSTGGTLNMEGLLLAAIIIGVLGVIDDLAVTQVSTVKELSHANSTLSRSDIYRSAMRVGKEHVGAVTNTLVFAYTGAALPLLLLLTLLPESLALNINSEVVATEIIRTAVGGIALCLILPIATILGVLAHPAHGKEVKD